MCPRWKWAFFEWVPIATRGITEPASNILILTLAAKKILSPELVALSNILSGGKRQVAAENQTYRNKTPPKTLSFTQVNGNLVLPGLEGTRLPENAQ